MDGEQTERLSWPSGSLRSEEGVKFQLSPTELKSSIRLNLRGKGYDRSSGQEIEVGARLVNDRGIAEIMNIVDAIIDRNTFLSVLGEDRVKTIMYNLDRALTTKLGTGAEDWKPKNYNAPYISPGDLESIRAIVIYPIYFALSRASGSGKTLELLAKSTHESIVRRDDEGEKKKKFGIF